MPLIKNYAYGFIGFLCFLVLLNFYFFYELDTINHKQSFNLPIIYKSEPVPDEFNEIFEFLIHLPEYYKRKNKNFALFQQSLISLFNYSGGDNNVWESTRNWIAEDSLFPQTNGASGRLLQAIRHSPIALADNAPKNKGSQLKLLLLLEGKQKLLFKPKRYDLNHVIQGSVIYGGHDRHNSEVFAYYLAMVLNFTWIAPATTRKLHIQNEILPVATLGLKSTMNRNKTNGALCVYGHCKYCVAEEAVCADNSGYLEGAAILHLDKPLNFVRSPWRRSYKSGVKQSWEKNNSFCKKEVIPNISKRTLLNAIDVAIFDFLIQNGDRYGYELYKGKIVLLDNGKGLGNPDVDELDILAPLYQCCMLSLSTWRHLELVSGGSLSSAVRALTSLRAEPVAAEPHYRALERRLLKVYAAIHHCIAKYGSAKVIQYEF